MAKKQWGTTYDEDILKEFQAKESFSERTYIYFF